MLENLELESDDNYGLLIDNAKVAVIDSTFTGKGLNGANIGLIPKNFEGNYHLQV